VSVATGWAVPVGAEINAAIDDPPGGLENPLGARVEMPYTRAIVSYYRLAKQDPTTGVWTVTLDGVPFAGLFQFVWRTNEAEPEPHPNRPSGLEFEVFLPLQVSTQVDGSGEWYPAMGENYPPVNTDEVTPTVDDVAQLERTRTVDDLGNEYITFTDATRPTEAEVQRIISDSVPIVLGMLPTVFAPHHWPRVKMLVSLYCAMTIEGSFFKEQALARGNANMPWEPEYTSALTNLENTINEDRRQNNLLGAMEPRPAVPPTDEYVGPA